MLMKNKKLSRREAMCSIAALGCGTAATTKKALAHQNSEEPASIGFERSLAMQETDIASNDDLEVTFMKSLCIHARYCVAWTPDVFRPGKSPWMSLDGSETELVSTVVRNCPSGALNFHRKDGGTQESPPAANLVYTHENGPLAFRADLIVDDELIGYRATLCRCGQSRNKPYCDRSHVKNGFVATGEVDGKNPPESISYREYLANPSDQLVVQTEDNGPYTILGALQICTGTGKRASTHSAITLCACGRSKNKPYCDGSHLDVESDQ